MNDPHEIARFATHVAINMPASMMIMGLPRVSSIDLAPAIAVVVAKVGVDKRKRFTNRIKLDYSKLAIGPRLRQAPQEFV